MNELSTKVEKNKINIFQRLRLELFKISSVNNPEKAFVKYKNAPDYIKNDKNVVFKMLKNSPLKEEKLSEIPETLLIDAVIVGIIKLENFSPKVQVAFFERNPDLLEIVYDNNKEYITKRICDIIINGDYSFIQKVSNYEKDVLVALGEHDNLEHVLPQILPYLTFERKETIVEDMPMLVTNLSEEDQIRISSKKPYLFKFIDSELQLKYINENPKYLEYMSKEARILFVERNPEKLTELQPKYQAEIVSLLPEKYRNISYEARTMIYRLNSPEAVQATIAMLKKDINNSKLLRFLEDKRTIDRKIALYDFFDGVEKLEDETLKNTILHSKMMGAIGKLSRSDYVFHGITAGEEIHGIDGYETRQIEILQKLSIEQMINLISIDNNYILPYLTGKEINALTVEEMHHSNWRCKTLFIEMFGREKLEEFSHSIEMIYTMQEKVNESAKTKEKHHDGLGTITDYDKFMARGEIPLEEFKLLFNRAVIANNSSEQIEAYLTKKMKGEDAGDLFREIIGRAYGEKAKELLESRPKLNVHSINSIEVFDSRIFGGFGEAFVHDAISYNLRDFSEFLEVVKNPQRLETFKTYYEALTTIYGQNVESMQKAISEYCYIEELLVNARDVELTDKQYSNLIPVICSIKNPLNIRTLEELQNYDEIANNELKFQLEKYIKSNNRDIEELKKTTSQNFFGIRYVDTVNTPYGTSIKTINKMYDLQEDERAKNIYTEDERRMLQILEFLGQETDESKLLDFADELMSQQGIRVPAILQSAISKTMREQTNILNNSLTSIDKMEELCKMQSDKEEPRIYKEESEGVTIYHLNGESFVFLAHDVGENAKLEDIMSYEGQAGNTAICGRVISSQKGNISKKLLYAQLAPDMLISSSERDAGTQHMSKRVKNVGAVNTKAKNISKMSTISGNEVAFYRRHRQHEKVQNLTQGGRLKPDAIGFYDWETIPKGMMDFCKKYGISIVVVHGDKYLDKEEKHQEEGR